MSANWSGTEGEARAGLQPGAIPGSWQLGGEDGPVIAAISFRDRSEAMALALRAPQAVQVALAHLRALSVRREGVADPQALDLAVLELAGAEDNDALPGFAETALCVARGAGLGLAEIAAAPAAEIDAMARVLLPSSKEDGTTRIVFASAPAADPTDEIEARLGGLLRRAAARPMTAPAVVSAQVPAPGPAGPAHPAMTPPAWCEAGGCESEDGTPPPAGRRPFRLAPAATAARDAARPVPSPPVAATWRPVASGQTAQRPALALVPPASPEAAAAPWPDDALAAAVASLAAAAAGIQHRAASGAAALGMGPAPLVASTRQPAPAVPRMLDPRHSTHARPALAWPGWLAAGEAAAAGPEMSAGAPLAAPHAPWRATQADTLPIADALAAALEDEADLRGLAP